jgi:hypothetical protein
MKFDSKKYKVYTWKQWMMLHYVLNPGIAVNELFFGQRVPKVSLEDKTSEKPFLERSYVPCPNCETLHDGRTWSSQNGTAFKNWFGLYCPNCGEIIPCLINLTTLLILAITFPIWGWFRKSLKKRWLEKQPKRYKEIEIELLENPFEGYGWIKMGLRWGILTGILMLIFFPLIGVEVFSKQFIVTIAAFVILGGLLFGFIMKLFFEKTGTEVA